ncbi:MAG: TauD/TfdA family dioxygenase, partial [Comamonadaceae bacterium]
QHGGRANSWHTDMSFTPAYPSVSILRAIVIPPYGGDTVWANTAAAYEHLPRALQALALSLRAVHGNDYDYAGSRGPTDRHDDGALQYRKTFTARVIETEHGVVQLHPQTGEKTLLVGHFAKRLAGQSSQDSAHLLGLLQNHITRLENTVRWRWSQGDVAIWDNRATQHYAINDYGDEHRVVRRVTVTGAAPVNADGLPSVRLTPEATPAPTH